MGPCKFNNHFNLQNKKCLIITHGGLLGGRGPSNTGFFNSKKALQLTYLSKATGNTLTDRNKHSALITAQPLLIHVIQVHIT